MKSAVALIVILSLLAFSMVGCSTDNANAANNSGGTPKPVNNGKNGKTTNAPTALTPQ